MHANRTPARPAAPNSYPMALTYGLVIPLPFIAIVSPSSSAYNLAPPPPFNTIAHSLKNEKLGSLNTQGCSGPYLLFCRPLAYYDRLTSQKQLTESIINHTELTNPIQCFFISTEGICYIVLETKLCDLIKQILFGHHQGETCHLLLVRWRTPCSPTLF